ncbi:MAG: DNA mismatch endonuclease Vsr [Acidobacteriota bacterium]
MDLLAAEARSENMRRIRAKDTAPELAVRRFLHRNGKRFRLHRTDLPGSPDIVLTKNKVAIFVHGCFWHGHSCRDGRRPKSNLGYWNAKLDSNRRRDSRILAEIRALGWRPLVVWACETHDPDKLRGLLVEINGL